jgi:hypothetical protein
MKKFHIIINDLQQGPFTVDELKEKCIQRNTLVWAEGMSDWQTADSIQELSGIFPPPVPEKTGKKNLIRMIGN